MSSTITVRPCPGPFSDHIFKTIHGVDVPLRVWPLPPQEVPAPWMLWIHGGAYISGRHHTTNPWVINAARQRGYHLVSTAYRFVPQVSHREMLEDCTDAFRWCLNNLPALLGDKAIKTSAYVLAGDSAGAGLAFMCGLYLEPRPSCVINLYGAFDMTDDFFYTVDPAHPVETPSGDFDEATIVAASQDYDARHAEVTCPWSHEIEPFFRIEQTRLAWGDPDFVVTRQHRLRDEVRKRLLGQRNLFRTLFQRGDYADDDTFLANVRQQSPLHILDGRSDYPPTFHLHGIKDTIVPVEHTQRLVAKLEQMGMPLEFILPADADHCFDCSVMVCILLFISAR